MLLPFVKCCLLLQLSMLRSTLQVLLLLCSGVVAAPCAAASASASVIVVAYSPGSCQLPSACCYWLCPQTCRRRIERRIHQAQARAQLTDTLALHSALSWNLHSDFSTYYVPWRLLLVALCALRYALMLSNCCLL